MLINEMPELTKNTSFSSNSSTLTVQSKIELPTFIIPPIDSEGWPGELWDMGKSG